MADAKQIRLSLLDRDHRKVRIVAASEGLSMARFASLAIQRHVVLCCEPGELLEDERAAPASKSLAPHPRVDSADPRHGRRIGVRLTEGEHEALRRAAEMCRLPMAEFARQAVMQAADTAAPTPVV